MKNRWFISLAAIGIHICIGSVYAWSVLTKPIMQEMGFTLKQTTWAFSLAILCLGLSAGFLGSYVEKYGPKKSGIVSMIFFCTGMFGTALALYWHSLLLLYVFYGIIGGIGLGIGYITPVSTLVKWFPDKRGFATGLAIMGFGFASLLAGPLMQFLVRELGLVMNFVVLGTAYSIIMTASALYLEPPKQDVKKTTEQARSAGLYRQFSAKEAMHTWQFYALWWVFFTNITCGIGLLSVASPMAQEIVKMSPVAAASMVGFIGLLNGLGRIVWASVSDYLGRGITYALFFAIEAVAFFLLADTSGMLQFQVLVFLIITCYGGGFSCMPAYLSDLFGTKQLSAIHGRILTAWGAAGVMGPFILTWLKEMTNGYAVTLYFFASCFVLSFLIALLLRATNKPSLAGRLNR
jgi:OFA family oxalate/formate antiporter-like MFS transporter